VLTAAALGISIIAAAAWGWGQAGIVRLPARAWTLSLSNVQGQIQQGDSVVLQYYDLENGNPEEITEMGSAIVENYDEGKSASGILRIGGFQNELVKSRASDAERIYIGELGAESVTAIVRGGSPTPIFPVLYLQVAVAGSIMLLGAIVIYIFVGSKKNSVEFLIATDGEMKKVNWTSYREVKGSTIVVIAATFLIAGFLFGVDTLFAKIFSAIGVLQK
jgi:preprotein translocase SecE subunit